MARLKRTSTAAPVPVAAAESFPEHVRVAEWNGLQPGDPVVISFPGKKYKKGVYWTFSAHVTSPGGVEYIDVYERKRGDPHGLWRSFRPDQVEPHPSLLKKRKKSAREGTAAAS
jgi:hypothetical protein